MTPAKIKSIASVAWYANICSVIGRKRELELMFQEWFEVIPELITATDEANILTTDFYDRPPLQP